MLRLRRPTLKSRSDILTSQSESKTYLKDIIFIYYSLLDFYLNSYLSLMKTSDLHGRSGLSALSVQILLLSALALLSLLRTGFFYFMYLSKMLGLLWFYSYSGLAETSFFLRLVSVFLAYLALGSIVDIFLIFNGISIFFIRLPVEQLRFISFWLDCLRNRASSSSILILFYFFCRHLFIVFQRVREYRVGMASQCRFCTFWQSQSKFLLRKGERKVQSSQIMQPKDQMSHQAPQLWLSQIYGEAQLGVPV